MRACYRRGRPRLVPAARGSSLRAPGQSHPAGRGAGASPTCAPFPPGPEPMTTRRHDIDALRALAFCLLILYHLAMLYVADWDWHIKSPDTFHWLQPVMIGLNR